MQRHFGFVGVFMLCGLDRWKRLAEGASWAVAPFLANSVPLHSFSRPRIMGKVSAFWDKYNIFKHWPPLVQAYRQNASGMEVSPSQKRYLRWGSLIPVILFAIGWFLYYLPYFKHQADISFFAYTGNFVQPFFDGTSAPRISEFLWRFVAQFYFNTPLIVAVVAFLMIGFCITSWATAGPYTPFLLLLYCLLFPSANPAQASIAISLWLNMGALSVFFLLFRHAAHHPRAWTPLILFHVYTAIAGGLLYYATGHWALLFCIAVVFSHLAGIPMALADKKQGLWKIRLWNFIVSLLLTAALTVCLWGISADAGFHAPWYTWMALIVFGIACVPGILLQAYNNRKIFLYEWNKRRGIHDGKPVLAPSHHILMTLVAVGFSCLVMFVFARNPLDRALVKAQNAVVRADYPAVQAACRKFRIQSGMEKGQLKARYETPSAKRKMMTLDLYSTLALSGQGMLPANLLDSLALVPCGGGSLRDPARDYACMKIYSLANRPSEVCRLILSDAREYGLQNRYMEPFVAACMATGNQELLQEILYYAKKSLYSKALYREYKDSVPQVRKGNLIMSGVPAE